MGPADGGLDTNRTDHLTGAIPAQRESSQQESSQQESSQQEAPSEEVLTADDRLLDDLRTGRAGEDHDDRLVRMLAAWRAHLLEDG